jgi:hypothetical protein
MYLTMHQNGTPVMGFENPVSRIKIAENKVDKAIHNMVLRIRYLRFQGKYVVKNSEYNDEGARLIGCAIDFILILSLVERTHPFSQFFLP